MNLEAIKIVKVIVKEDASRYAVSQPIYKEDYGLYFLIIEGLELPEVYTVDFSNSETTGNSVSMLGNSDGVLIPRQFIDTGKDIFAFLYITGDGFGRTIYKFKIPNRIRPDRTNEEPEPEEQSLIDQAISELNNAVEQTAQDVQTTTQKALEASESAQSASISEQNASNSAETAVNAKNIAEDCAEVASSAKNQAVASATSANQSANTATVKASEASASAVTASNKADEARASATSASNDASIASSAAESAGSDAIRAERASDAAQGYASNAQLSATQASNSASSANLSAQASAQSASKAEQDRIDADRYAQASAQSASASANSAEQAESAKGVAQSYAQDAQTSATYASTSESTAIAKASEASGYAQTASQKATESAQSASQALTHKNDAESAKTASQTAQGLAESARDTAVQAKTDAESARDETQNLVDGISGKVEQIDSNTERIESLEDDKYKPYVVDTASGSIASFPDGADNIPLKSLVVDINPVQDLHGQDAPYPAGGGVNQWDEQWEVGSINAQTGQPVSSTTQIRSVDFCPCVPNTEYVKVHNPTNLVNIFWYDENKDFISVNGGGGNNPYFVVTSPENARWFKVRTDNAYGGTYGNDISINYPSTDTSYHPYENICPISGWTEVDVEQSGVNVWDEEWEVGGIRPQNGILINEQRIRSKNLIPCVPNTTYYILDPTNGDNIRVFYYAKDGSYIGCTSFIMGAQTTPNNARFMRFIVATAYGTTYNHDISINYPATDHDYHPYTRRSITISLGQTVYGGKLDVLSGKLVVDRAMATFTGADSESWQLYYTYANHFQIVVTPPNKKNDGVEKNAISNVYTARSNYANNTSSVQQGIFSPDGNRIRVKDTACATVAEFKAKLQSLSNGLQVCYKLATPIEIQLSVNQINSLYGVNNIWSDTGDSHVEYRADTKLYIERLTAPDLADMVADANITSGQYFMVGNSLYLATANIANGAQIIVGTNAVRKSLSEALNEINA